MTARTPQPATPSDVESDASRRYVLPADAPYLANLAALWANEPVLAARIESLPDDARYIVEPSKAGPPTVALPGPGGKAIYLHSRYQPIDEAKALVEDAFADEPLAYYVHGLGLGYHLDALFDGAGTSAVFFVFEPDLALIRTAFETRDFVRLIESRRVAWIVDADKAALLQTLNPHTAMISVGVSSVIHPPSMQVAPAFHEQIKAWTEEYASFTLTSMNTLVLNSRRTAENIARNIGWYASVPGPARLKDRHKGQPAVIVSAGPSLRKNKHLLPDLKGKAVLVAVQTTLQPMLEMGVEPDYVTSLDYHDISTRFYEKLPATLNTELVAETKAASKIFTMFPGKLTLTGNDFSEKLLREMNVAKEALPAGATVAHLAFYLAQHLGCDPIIFVGQDLGFSDGLCYAPGTSYEDVWRPELSRFCTMEMRQWDQIARERFILRRIPDQQGRPMYTEARLFSYLQQFERDFATSPAQVIDASEGGALKRGAAVMTLAEVITQFCTTPLRATPDDYPGTDFQRLEEAAGCLRNRKDEARRIEEVARETLPLLQRIHDKIDNQSLVNRLIGEIDALRVKMNDLGPCYELVVQLTQQTELDRFKADRRLTSDKLDAHEKQRRQVQRDIDNVRGVMHAATAFQHLMDEAIDRLRTIEAPTAIPLPPTGKEAA